MSVDLTDNRFRGAFNDPKFRRPKSSDRGGAKIKPDDRFRGVLKDDRFRLDPGKEKSSVDKYGRKVKAKRSDEMEEFYELEVESSSKEKPNGSKSRDMGSRLDYLNKLARGEISDDDSSSDESSTVSESDSDESDEDSSTENESSRVNTKPKSEKSLISKFYDNNMNDEEGSDLEVEAESTHRLAIQNCDWSNLRAVDIMMVLQSFCPSGGTVKRVTVYPSDFGKERMQYEQIHGPQGIWETVQDEDDSESDAGEQESGVDIKYGKDDRGEGDFRRKKGVVGLVIQNTDSEEEEDDDDDNGATKNSKSGAIDPIRLREYELNRLRYYFAIAEFDSVGTAEAIYKELDGVEFEHSSMVFDLRFVPNDISFDDRDIRDSVSDMPAVYEPPDFIINALQHTNVECTWDKGETERDRKLTNISAWKSLEESDLQQYIASESSDESDDEGNAKSRKAKNIRKLLLGDAASEDDEEDDDRQRDEFFNEDDDDEDSGGNKSLTYVPDLGKDILNKKNQANETVFEAKMRQMNEKKKQRKERKKELALSAKQASDDLPQNPNKHDKRDSVKEAASAEQLELLLADDDEFTKNDYNMRDIAKEAKKKKGKNSKKRDADADPAGGNFEVNVTDPRFQKLFTGNGNFGIDRTKTEFKETPGMAKILEEQRKRRKLDENVDSAPYSEAKHSEEGTNIEQLVKNLKKKFK